jgi:putative membrane protein
LRRTQLSQSVQRRGDISAFFKLKERVRADLGRDAHDGQRWTRYAGRHGCPTEDARRTRSGSLRCPLKAECSKEETTMRWFHTAVIVVLVAVTLIFAIQNLQGVTVSFLNFKVSSPLAVLVALVYVLGMLTGGSAWALIKWAIDKSASK